MPVRVRYAPSPTGALHLGSARTVLFNYLYARKQGGQFILRIEDTDQARYDENSLASILEGIRWLRLDWDEGPEAGGPHDPYFQSQRLHLYQADVERLVAAEHAYRCFCTPERLAELRKSQEAMHQPTRYDGFCRDLTAEEVGRRMAAGEPSVVRMRVPEGRTVVEDLVRGRLEFDNATIDDQVLLKSDGFPTYHLASVVDDHLMQITHVIRGDEWLPSSPKHVLLYEMLGWAPPVFVHLPLVLGPDRAKLSKRHGAVSLLEYRDLGYLPEAMVNFLAFLGWSPGTGREHFSLDELVDAFELEKVQASPAVFDQAKLDSVNGEHIRALSPTDFAARLKPWVPELTDDLLTAAAPLIQTRVARLGEASPLLEFLVHAPTEYEDGLVPRGRDVAETARILAAARELLSAGGGPDLEEPLRELAERHGWKAKELFMSLRIALTGRRVTPPLLESTALLPPGEWVQRLNAAIEHLTDAAPGAAAGE
jgi:glutamyl-tRNA synthetase